MTNNPTTYWAPSTALSKLESRHNNAPCVLTDGPAEFNDIALVRLADYEALQAAYEEELFQVRQDRDRHFGELMRALEQVDALQVECERWKRGSEIRDEQNRDLHSFIMELKAECGKLRAALAESRANDLTAMGYLNQIRQLVGGDDFPDMVRRCEKLRKDAERYQWLRERISVWRNNGKGSVSYFPVTKVPASSSLQDETDAAIDAAMEGAASEGS